MWFHEICKNLNNILRKCSERLTRRSSKNIFEYFKVIGIELYEVLGLFAWKTKTFKWSRKLYN